jgi:hypothetical protein
MGGGNTAPTPAPTVATTSTTEATTSTTEATTSTTEATTTEPAMPSKVAVADAMAKADELGDTPEAKYGNAVFVGYMLTAFELTLSGTDMEKSGTDLAKVKEIAAASVANFEEIKKAADGLTAPKGYETTKESFMTFVTKTQEAMKAVSEAKDEKMSKELQAKFGEIMPLSQEVMTNLTKAGYKPSEEMTKYIQEAFMGGSPATTEEGTTEGTTEEATTEEATTEGGASTETTETGK